MRHFQCGSPLHPFMQRPAEFRFARLVGLSGIVPVFLLLLLSLPDQAQKPPQAGGQDVKKGQTLFLKNCSPCHGAKAQGGEGPNLHGLKLSSQQMTETIKKGFKGDMPAFGSKLKEEDIKRLVTYLQSLQK